MTAAPGRWADLRPRLISAMVMAAVAAFEVWIGGPVFEAFIAFVCAAMVWELARMLGPDRPTLALVLAALTAAAVFVDPRLPAALVLPVLVAPAIIGAGLMPARQRALFFGFAF
jgi:phosphatidate cytidylyltransferase